MPRINNGWMLSPRQDKYTIPSKPLGTRAGTLRKRLQENARGLLYDTNKISEQLWWSSAFSMHETGPVHSHHELGRERFMGLDLAGFAIVLMNSMQKSYLGRKGLIWLMLPLFIFEGR